MKRIVTFALLIPLALFFFYHALFLGRIYPGIYLAGEYVGGETPEKVATVLSEKIKVPKEIVLTASSQSFSIPLSELDFAYDFDESARRAYELDRSGNIFYDLSARFYAPFRKKKLGLILKFDEEKLKENLSVVAGQIAVEPVYPSVKFVKGEVSVERGKAGSDVDLSETRVAIGQSLAYALNSPITISIKTVDPSLSEAEAEVLEERAKKLLGKTLNIDFEFQTFTYKGNDLLAFLGPKGDYDEGQLDEEVGAIAKEVDRDPQNPTFVFEAGRVKEFAPSKDGIKTRVDELEKKISETLARLEKEGEKVIAIEVPVDRTPPAIQTSDVNDLGIKELIGRGTSRFRGSIASRIYNISLASSRLNGVVIKPGEIFSFNSALGDVSKFTGYKEAYVIKDGKTVLGDGGGVCQVSSTLFRAVLNAGLPIVERRAHSYRVGYYEQDSLPGFDATVYSPTTDLRIKNDTPAYILIQASANPKNSTLVFELYGTKDGRIASTTKPKVADVVPAPEDLYQDDPTLPIGQIKQIDYKAAGAKVTFSYTVEKDGEAVYQKTFVSNYRPWQAIYLRGTGPAQ